MENPYQSPVYIQTERRDWIKTIGFTIVSYLVLQSIFACFATVIWDDVETYKLAIRSVLITTVAFIWHKL